MIFMAKVWTVYFQPYKERSEHCSIGIIVQNHTGRYSAHLISDLRKAEAMYPAMSAEQIKEIVTSTVSTLNREDHGQSLFPLDEHAFPKNTSCGVLRFSSEHGYVRYEDDCRYQEGINWLLSISCEPDTIIVYRGLEEACQ